MNAPSTTRANTPVSRNSRRDRIRRGFRLAPHPLIALVLVAGLAAATHPPRVADDLRPAANMTSAPTSTTRPTVTMYTGPSGVVSGRVYRAGAFVHAYHHSTTAIMQIRQVQNGAVVASHITRLPAYTSGTRGIVSSLVARSGGGYVQVLVRVSGTSYATAYFSRLAVSSYAYTASAATTCVSDPKGMMPAGRAYAGQAASGTVSLTSRESSYGRTVGVHRVYGQWQDPAAAGRIAADDIAHNRIPWVSFTVPSTWANMAAGRYDSWVLSVISKLNALNGPVWLTFVHEPEHLRNSQNVAYWVKMQRHLLPMVKAHSRNIATSIILEGWYQYARTDSRLTFDALWPGDGLVDVIGLDPYNFYGTRGGSGTGSYIWTMTDLRPWFSVFRSFATAHHTRWGLSETGYTDSAASKDVYWINNTFKSMVAYGGIAMSYFDSTIETNGGTWDLGPTSKRAAYAGVVRSGAKIC